jgi:16S rRNA (cytosine967-C5)-methyltransferase
MTLSLEGSAEIDEGDQKRNGDPVQRLADTYSFAPWMVQRFIEYHGATGAEHLCRALNQQAPIAIRVNTLKTDRHRLQKFLSANGIESTPTKLSSVGLLLFKRLNVFRLDAFRQGLFEVQDEGSQMLPLLLDPKPTAKVLDACAGAGGKTLELSALMNNEGEVVAIDVSARRLEELQNRARRAGAQNIRIRKTDLTRETLGESESNFDVVLVDAPCSGTGTIRRNPGLKWTVSQNSVHELNQKQSLLLMNTSRLVKPGGILWYCTCSLLRGENEGIVEEFLSSSPSFALLDPSSFLERVGLPDAQAGSSVHLLPHRHGTDGFFCAALQRMA